KETGDPAHAMMKEWLITDPELTEEDVFDEMKQDGGNREELCDGGKKDKDVYDKQMKAQFENAKVIGDVDVVVGIPFHNEVNTIENVVKKASKGLEEYFHDKDSVIICVGSPESSAAEEVLEIINSVDLPDNVERMAFILSEPGKGAGGMRPIMDLAVKWKKMKACCFIDADELKVTEKWIPGMINPILIKGYDYVAALFTRPILGGTITKHLAYPLIGSLYLKAPRQPIVGEFAFSRRLIKHYLRNAKIWNTNVGAYGVDNWLTTEAIKHRMKMIEIGLGTKVGGDVSGFPKRIKMFKQVSSVIFEQLKDNAYFWKGIDEVGYIDRENPLSESEAPIVVHQSTDWINEFKNGFLSSKFIYENVLPSDIFAELTEKAKGETDNVEFNPSDWAKSVYAFALYYGFNAVNEERFFTALAGLWMLRVGSFIKQTVDMNYWQSEWLIKEQLKAFIGEREKFVNNWNNLQAINMLDGGEQTDTEKLLEKIFSSRETEEELGVLKEAILADRIQREVFRVNEGNVGRIVNQRLEVFKKVYSAFEVKREELKIEASLINELWDIYIPFAEWAVKEAEAKKERGEEGAYILGLNGAQGSGKTTMNEFLRVILGKGYGKNAAGFSIDDIYKTYEDREAMGKEVHPLFAIRGVVGTHEVKLGVNILEELKGSREDSEVGIPQFDKTLKESKGDRIPKEEWSIVKGKVDIVIFEGWCVGVRAQGDEKLKEAINRLEREEDAEGVWRRRINEEIKDGYAGLFAMLDSLVMIKIPGIQTVFRNREEQERKAREGIEEKKSRGEDIEGLGAMSEEEVIRFVNFFERLTVHMLEEMPERADLVFEMGEGHRIDSIYSKEIQAGGSEENRMSEHQGATKVTGSVDGRDLREVLEQYGLSKMEAQSDEEINEFRVGLAEAVREEIGEVELGLLTPYFQEYDNAAHVLRTMIAGYEEYFADKRGVIVAVGTKAAGEAGERARASLEEEANKYEGDLKIIILHLDEIERGKGRGLRWAFAVAHELGAKAVLHLDADLYTEIDGVSSREKAVDWSEYSHDRLIELMEAHRLRGLSPYWVKAMVEPVLD
ncbi:MAG: hypothetical protein KAJ14_09025, partial [Candidatus Omnitrophica bacterium]|nr:hypothetical protein [Candidatus Omnitrophota bacterium]